MIQQIYVSSKIPGFLNDLEACWPVIVSSVVLSFVICSIYIEFMSKFAETIAWISLIFVQISLIGASIGSVFLRFWLADQVIFMREKKYPESMI